MSEAANNLNAEKLRCPECEKSFSTNKTIGIGNERSIPCPNCRKENKLGLWRAANEPEEKVAFMPVESPPEPIPDQASEPAPVPESVAETKPGDGEQTGPAAGVTQFTWMLLILPVGLAFVISCLAMLGSLTALLVRTDRFATDNAYGATANALEQIEVMFASQLCLIVTVVLFKILHWAMKASAQTK